MRTRFLLIACLFMATQSFAQASKQKITRAADLPRFQYSVKGKVEDLVKSEALFRPFAAEVRKNVESVLRDYDIEDPSTSRSLLSILVALDILDNRDGSARDRLQQIKAIEEKPAAKALSGLVENAILDARREVPNHNSPAYRQAVSAALKHSLDTLSFDLVQNDLKEQKANAEFNTESLLIGQVRAALDPVVEKTGGLSGDMAHSLVGMRMTLLEVIPLRETLAQTITAYLASNAKEKKDIWADRNVILDPEKKYQPVNVAVWDTGVDLDIYKDQVAKDAAGKPAVLAYDLEFKKAAGSLYPLNAEQSRRYLDVKKQIKGLMDSQANIDSPEAAEIRRTLSKLKPEEVRPFIEELSFFFGYLHGTSVAGIVTAGNPYVRLVTGRLTLDWKMIPDPCPSREWVDRFAAASQDYVDFFKKDSVRVVNMSWGYGVKSIEGSMESCGIGKNTDERKKTAREWFEVIRSGLEKAMSSAPAILFVAAAGNSNTDSSFDEDIPSSLKAPNLLIAGAVDKAGDEAGFTSYGPTVVVHANGFEVESYIPGGDRLILSGTSISSPNTANLAAKIITVNPKLNPAQVIEIIRATAERTTDGRRNLINPKKAIAAATAP
jgi:subtilisin family serine protease